MNSEEKFYSPEKSKKYTEGDDGHSARTTLINSYDKLIETEVLFVGPLIHLFWTFGDVSCGFQSQNGQPYSHLVEAYMLHIP